MNHRQVEVTIEQTISVDAAIAPEIIWLNRLGVHTVASCQGPPPSAVIMPSSRERAQELGYDPQYNEATGYFEMELQGPIWLKDEQARALAALFDKPSELDDLDKSTWEPIQTSEEFVRAFLSLFAEVETDRTLRETGHDPEEIAAKTRATVERLFAAEMEKYAQEEDND